MWSDVTYADYQQWIDQSLRNVYPNAPQTVQEVEKFIHEGEEGDISVVYFFLEFHGTREYENQWLSVDYATRDGSAIGFMDYIPVDGTLILYPGENSAVVPVEIIGDNAAESNEHFYLDVYNPIGGNFANGVDILSASRTIIDDDGLYIA